MATIFGTDGNDKISPTESSVGTTSTDQSDTIYGLAGNDLLDGGAGADNLDGGTGDDRLYGGADNDALYAGEGNDLLDGGPGGDYMVGGTGDDIYYVDDSWGDSTVEQPREGTDTTVGRYLTLRDSIENLIIDTPHEGNGSGNALDNVITGNDHNNLLYGYGGSDHLIGNGGNDTLVGDGEHADTGQVSLYNVALGVGGLLFAGEVTEDGAGAALAAVGDVDGDGRSDIAVGATGNDAGGTNAGAVYVVFAPSPDDWRIDLGTLAATGRGFKLVGEAAGDQAGTQLTGLGDLNGDGLTDFALGAAYNDEGGSDAGAVYVVFGRADTTTLSLTGIAAGVGGYKIVGENAWDYAGSQLKSVGDLNGDGLTDLLIGAYGNDEGGDRAGAAYVVYGKGDGTKVNLDDVAQGIGGYKIVGENAEDYAGLTATVVSDLNGDGRNDLLIGAPYHRVNGQYGAGAVYVVYTPESGGKINLDDVAQGIGGVKIAGEWQNHYVGNTLGTADANGDGREDLLIGANGVTYVVFGSDTALVPFKLSEVGSSVPGYQLQFGGTPVGVGDLNGDGREEMLLTSFGSNGGAVVWGKGSAASVPAADISAGGAGFAIYGQLNGGLSAVAEAGDLDGDGIPDLLVGQAASSGQVGGGGYVIFGAGALNVRGDDLLEGGEGDDGLTGGGGNDTLDGGPGSDTADYSGVRGAVLADLGAGLTTQDGMGGQDTLIEMENLRGSAHNDKLRGSEGANVLNGQDGADQLDGGGGADRLDGGSGNDTLIGGAGDDTLTGGPDSDRFVLTVGMGQDTLTDFTRGSDRIDVTAFGALLPDWAALSTRLSYVSNTARLDLGGGDLLILNNILAGGLSESDFTGLGAGGERWTGTPGDDVHTGTPFDDVLDGLAGNDTLNGGDGDDLVVGDSGGEVGGDILRGGAGNDTLEGNAGDDLLDGGPGIDTADYSRALGSVGADLTAGVASDDGDLGRDTLISIENLIGSPSADYLVGSAEDNSLVGLTGNDVLKGLDGNDLLDGGAGADNLDGGTGDDRLYGGADNDALYAGEGNDLLDGGPGGDYMVGGTGDDIYYVDDSWGDSTVEQPREGTDTTVGRYLTLRDSIENLIIDTPHEGNGSGNALDNVITGNDHNNLLYGYGGSDHLIGNGGNDTLVGDGEHADTGQVSLYNVALGVGGLLFAGEVTEDGAGAALAAVGDVDGDGRSDIAVGATGNDAGGTNAGAVYVVFAPSPDDWRIDLGTLAATGRGFKLVGEAAGDQAGTQLTGLGDLNGDGLTDFALGAAYNDEGGSDAGAVYVVFGRADTTTLSLTGIAAGVGGYKIVGENAWDYAGSQLKSVGDLNGDGLTDLLIGAYGNDEGGDRAGAAYVVYGKGDGTKVNLDDVAQGIGGYKIVGENAEDYAGLTATVVSDLNGDGRNDLLIGAPYHRVNGQYGAGAVYVVYTPESGGKINLDDVAQGIGGVKIAGEWQNHYVGNTLGTADANGDGREDLLIGANGVTYVVFGSDTALVPFKLSEVGSSVPGYQLQFGGTPVGVGDLNGDGREEMLLTSFGSNGGAVVWGKGSAASVPAADISAGGAGFAIYGQLNGGLSAVAEAGDLDGDGIPDLLVGQAASSGQVGGGGYVIFGAGALNVRGDDLLEGGEGDDGLTGGGGNDTLDGGPGSDTADYSGVRGAVLADLGAGLTTQDGMGGQDTLIEMENLRGSAHNDKLRGSEGANVLNGQDGADQLDGGGGADRLDGGSGNDTLIGGAGDDTLTGGPDSDRFVLTVGMGQDTLTDFTRGSDRIDVTAFGALLPDWAALSTRLSYVSNTARLDLGGGDLLILNNILAGGLSESDFTGLGAGGERWTGTPGDDVHTGTPFDDVLDGLAGNDTLNGGDGDDLVVGDSGGEVGGDILRGGAGNDTLEGNAGDDLLDGGPGIDTADYSRALGSVGADLTAGVASDDGDLGRDTLISIENLIGSPSADYLVGSAEDNSLVGLTGNDVLKGLDGNDLLDGGAGADNLDGGTGDDRLYGGIDEDVLYGGEGNDTLDGGGGYDVLVGGRGDDIYITEDATKHIGNFNHIWETPAENPREGTDLAVYPTGTSRSLPDSVENALLPEGGSGTRAYGNEMDNIVTGNANDNLLYGYGGSDHLIGNGGNDTLVGDGEHADTGQVSLYNVALGVGGLLFAGEVTEDGAGAALAAVGDVDGDGRSDIAVGATGNDAGGTNAGAVYVVFAPSPDDWRIDLGTLAATGRGFKLVGEAAGDQAGTQLTGLGDLNGDGLTDFALGAAYNDEGGSDAGAVYVVFGRADTTTLSLTGIAAGVGGYKIVGENAWDYAGSQLKSVGDLNGDGLTDLLIGAYGNDEGGDRAGAAYVVYGKGDGTKVNLDDVAQGIGGYKIVGENAEDYAGLTATVVSDLNGDGRNDLLIGAPYHRVNGQYGAGAVYVVYTPESGGKINLDDVAQGIGGVKIAGEWQNHYVGNTLGTADANGDGREDLLIGANGVTYVVFGSDTALVPFKLSEVGSSVPGYQLQFGGTPVGVGDLNGDGREEMLLTSFGSNGGAVVWGKGSAASVPAADISAGGAGFAIYGQLNGGLSAVAEAGDLDGDGIPDLLVGQAASSGQVGGGGYVIFGAGALNVRGDDLLEGGEGDDGLIGGGGNDTLLGGPGNDALQGGDGDDLLDPGTGGDGVDGGAGNDRLVLDWSNVMITGPEDGIVMNAFDENGLPTDDPSLAVEWSIRQQVSTANQVSVSSVESFSVTGTAADDVLQGTESYDFLLGGAGNDVLQGFGGGNLLEGGLGSDILIAGTGADIFSGTLVELSGDLISNFSTEDALIILGAALAPEHLSYVDGALFVDANLDGIIEAKIGLPLPPINHPVPVIVKNLPHDSVSLVYVKDEEGSSGDTPDPTSETWVCISGGGSVLEGSNGKGGTFTFTVTRSGNLNVETIVDVGWYSLGINGADYSDFIDPQSLSQHVTFPRSEKYGSESLQLSVTLNGDNKSEADEDFFVKITSLQGGKVFSSDCRETTGTIIDDDSKTISIAWGVSRDEGTDTTDPIIMTEYRFTVTRGDPSGRLEVPYEVKPGPDFPANEIDIPGLPYNDTVVFEDGEMTAVISVEIQPDDQVEEDETFIVELGNISGWNIVNRQAVGIIGNDDSKTLSIVSAVTKDEGTDTTDPITLTDFDFTVTRSDGNGRLEVPYGVTPGPSIPADATDIPGFPFAGKLVFEDGETTAVITVKVQPDNQIEQDETFFVTLGEMDGWKFNNRQAVGTINDDDAQNVSIVGGVGRSEGDSGSTKIFSFMVTRSNTKGELDLGYGVTGGQINPADGNDVPGLSYFSTLHFDEGVGQKAIGVVVAGDDTQEPNETFFVILSDPGNGITFGNRQAVGTINNDDIPLPPYPRPISHGDPHLVTLDGLAYDFQAVGEFVLMRSENGTDVAVQVRTTAVGDLASNTVGVAALIEGHRVTILADNGATLRIDGVETKVPEDTGFIALGAGTVAYDGSAYTLIDPDGAGLYIQPVGDRLDLVLSVDPTYAGGLQGLLGNFNGDVTDDLALADGTVLSQPLAFDDLYGSFADAWRVTDTTSMFDYGPGESTATYTDLSFPRQAVTLNLLPDAAIAWATALVDEAGIVDPVMRDAAILDIALTADTSYLLSGTIPVTINGTTELVGGPAALPVLSVVGPDSVQWEGDSGHNLVHFDVYRTGSLVGALGVSYEVVPVGQHPVDVDDFGGTLPSGSFDFADGEGVKSLDIAIAGDTIAEYNEGFAVRLSVAEADRDGVLFALPSAKAVIENDDGVPLPRVSIGNAQQAEGDSGQTVFTFTLTRSGDFAILASPTMLDWVVTGVGTAPAEASDFSTAPDLPSGSVTFEAGEISTIVSVFVRGDTEWEPNETFAVVLSNLQNGTFDNMIGAATIINDDVTLNLPPTASPIDAGTMSENGSVVSIDLLADASAVDSDGGTLSAEDVTVEDGNGNPVLFGLTGSVLTIDPAQFATALNTGDNLAVNIAYKVTDGQGGVTPNTGTLVVAGLDGPFTWYLDGDADGFGVDDPITNQTAYEMPAGSSDVAGDNDDADASVFPGAPEINDGKDNDQDGNIDEDNRDPGAIDDVFTVAEDNTLAIPVSSLLANDSDADGDALTVSGVSGAVNGTAVLDDKGDADASNDEVIFTPDAGFYGEAVFDYTISDGFGGSASAAVNIEVEQAKNIIIGTEASDNLVGTSDSDVIVSRSGSYDRMAGGDGADEFVFGAETRNGIRERDVILDYQVGIDSIVFTGGTGVASVRHSTGGAVIFLEGDLDAIYVRGDGVTEDNLTILADAEFDFG